MQKTTLQSIKWENIRSVFDIIASEEHISRAELASRTNLSLVTIGKTADALLDNQIVCQTKEIKSSAGRRAGSLAVNEDKYILVFDFSDEPYTGAVYDLRLRKIEQFECTDSLSPPIGKRLSSLFATVAKNIFDNRELDDCCGIGVCLSNEFKTNACDINEERIHYILSECFFGFPYIVDFSVNAASFAAIRHIEKHEEQSVLFFDISETYTAGSYYINGSLILGKNNRFCELGEMRDGNGDSLFDLDSQNVNSFVEGTVHSFANLLHVLSPHTVCIHSPFDMPEKCFFPLLEEKLTEKYAFSKADLPEFTKADPAFYRPELGIALKVREEWLKCMLIND